MTRRRARGLTEADRALWRAYAAEVAPLPGRELPPEPSPAPVPSATVPAMPAAALAAAPPAA